uniref:Uncharacterized protein n=1 Tax=Glycine max TaxID=3847 RepID=C6SXP7_SOYBN|nr:unknown [Glycine max]
MLRLITNPFCSILMPSNCSMINKSRSLLHILLSIGMRTSMGLFSGSLHFISKLPYDYSHLNVTGFKKN